MQAVFREVSLQSLCGQTGCDSDMRIREGDEEMGKDVKQGQRGQLQHPFRHHLELSINIKVVFVKVVLYFRCQATKAGISRIVLAFDWRHLLTPVLFLHHI